MVEDPHRGWGTALSIKQTSDSGYIASGTGQYGNTADNYNVVLSKLDANGNIQWNKVYGGNKYDWGHETQQTADGGYIVSGWTESFGAGSLDCFLIKTDAGGNVQWAKTYGGTGTDICHGIQQTSDGGYAATGSFNGKIYLLKTDGSGALEWSRT